jgi:hypothetical protein
MSTLYNTSIPINIKNNNGYSQPTNKYIFYLYIYDSKKNEKCIKKIELKPYSKLIKFNDRIKFADINSFKVIISQEIENNILDYNLEGNINTTQTTYIQQNENIFIEFTNNTNGFSLCSCSLTTNNIFVSPPNY